MGVDKMSQFMICEKIPNQKANTVSKVLEKWSLTLGLPTVIKSDGGPCFKAGPFSAFCQEYGISHILTSPYNPTSNGQVERSIGEIKKLMIKNPQFSPFKAAFVLNNMERRGNMGTPLNLFMGRSTRGLDTNSQNKHMDKARSLKLRQEEALKKYKKKGLHYNRDSFKVGDRVLVQCPFSKSWTKAGVISEARVVAAGQGARSFLVSGDDGKEYFRNTRFLQHESSPVSS